MHFKHLLGIVFTLSGPVSVVRAGCECWWEGTAPFCNSNCPSGSHSTGIFSNSGNSGYCITGKKQKCIRCGPDVADKPCCIPTHTCAQCVGFVMICNEAVTDIPPVKCGSHLCGICTGSIPNMCPTGATYEEWTPPRPGDAVPTPWNPFHLLPSLANERHGEL
jgi:hypothetical protein